MLIAFTLLLISIILVSVGPLSMYFFVFFGALLIGLIGIRIGFGLVGFIPDSLALVLLVILITIGVFRFKSL